ncbi:hypothetical protein CVT26_015211 [Gymnopilus dilepis]|uniref:Uncharacterized protein n=1 Tax=Gymnopilus dilepis TaxID=231916 RepID=A0A409WS44_9AGAR|nr:hypothetical protein CVT26_015211 [Gymnopilus dilepis]
MASSQPKIKAWKPYVPDPENGKLRLVDPSAPKETNDIASAVIAHLTGRQQTRPRKKTAVNVWRKTQRHNIEARVKNLMHAQGIVKDRMAAVRDKVAREMFNALPPSVREKWKEEAKRETELDIQEWERFQREGPSTSPADRQMQVDKFAPCCIF